MRPTTTIETDIHFLHEFARCLPTVFNESCTSNNFHWELRNAMTHQQGSVLITGGLGFIGLNLAKRIAQVENVLVCRPLGSVLSKPKRIILLDQQQQAMTGAQTRTNFEGPFPQTWRRFAH